MEKRVWSKPLATVENFEVNEYIAACTDLENKFYKFECDATGGIAGYVYEETNGTSGFQITGDTLLTSIFGGYHACGETHYAPLETTDFVDGYYLTAADYIAGGTFVTPVVIWKGEGNDNVHCTKNLNVETEIVTGNKS